MKPHPSNIHREEHREVTEHALCALSSAAVTYSPISSLLTAGTVTQYTTLSQTLQYFVMNWTQNTRLFKAHHIQHLGRLPPDGRHNFLFFIYYVVEQPVTSTHLFYITKTEVFT